MDFVIHNADEELTCVVFNHPLVVEILESLDLGKRKQKIKILDLLIYPEFLQLLKNAEFVASDSATLQQELHYMGKPLLGLREYTEQTEGVGGNFVLSKGNKQVIKDFLKNYKKYETKPVHPKKRPATIVVDYLLGR